MIRGMSRAWSADELEHVGGAEELEVAARRLDGTLRRWTPIWVVRVGDEVFARTWHRRETGWYGRAVRDGRARVRAPGVELDVVVHDVGADLKSGAEAQRAAVDDAYRDKYGRYGAATVDRMVSDDAAGTTLRLTPDPSEPCPG